MQLSKRAFLRFPCVLAAIVLFASVSAAQPKNRADVPYKEGVELAKAGKNEAALSKFEEAYSFTPSGSAAYQIGRMEQALGRHALALQHYREALRDTSLPNDMRRDAEKAVDDLKTKVGVLTLDVPPGSTTTVDGNEVDSKNALELVPGLHVVKIRLGTETRSVDVEAKAGVVTPVKVRFDEAPPSSTGPTPPKTTGTEPPPATGTEPSSWTTPRIVTVAGLGAGAVALGVLSFVFHGKAEDAVDEAKGLLHGASCVGVSSPDCSRASALKDDRDSDVTISNVMLVGGIALAAGAVVAAVLWPKSEKSSAHVTILPSRIAGGGGAVLGGHF